MTNSSELDIIHVRNVVKSFRSLPVLQNMNWSVKPGQFWGIIGPNGSGKTTLLNLISGVEQPDQGEITFGGKSLTSYGRKELSRKLAVLQQDGLPSVPFPVRDVIQMGRFPFQDWRGKETDENAEQLIGEIMEKLELEELGNRPLSVLSGGQRQRVALGKVMAQQPEVVLLDEPTTYLDIRYQMRFMELVSSWQREEGSTVIAVMHDLNLAALFCDRLLVLQEGKIAAEGTPDEIISSETMEKVFEVKTHVVTHPDVGAPQLLLRTEKKSLVNE